MMYVVVCGRAAATLFAYDTTSGEQQQLDEVVYTPNSLPAVAALRAFRRRAHEQYIEPLERMCARHVADKPLILALTGAFSERVAAELVAALAESPACRVQTQCSVKGDGQFGFNEVVRGQLVRDDATTVVVVAK